MIDNNGYIISIWKKPDWTSNDVIKYVKPFIRTLKVGHAGTLDPNAEGILPIAINKTTKLIPFVSSNSKKYN